MANISKYDIVDDMSTGIITRTSGFVAVLAIALGFISARFLLQGNPLVALPWGVLAICSAFAARTRREALMLGGLAGFVASYSYLWFDNTETMTIGRVITLCFLIALPALFGMICGLGFAWLGWIIKQRLGERRHTPRPGHTRHD